MHKVGGQGGDPVIQGNNEQTLHMVEDYGSGLSYFNRTTTSIGGGQEMLMMPPYYTLMPCMKVFQDDYRPVAYYLLFRDFVGQINVEYMQMAKKLFQEIAFLASDVEEISTQVDTMENMTIVAESNLKQIENITDAHMTSIVNLANLTIDFNSTIPNNYTHLLQMIDMLNTTYQEDILAIKNTLGHQTAQMGAVDIDMLGEILKNSSEMYESNINKLSALLLTNNESAGTAAVKVSQAKEKILIDKSDKITMLAVITALCGVLPTCLLAAYKYYNGFTSDTYDVSKATLWSNTTFVNTSTYGAKKKKKKKLKKIVELAPQSTSET
ncbi:MAG: hypothetical protein AAF392_03245 [Bacteroidota bacterium]